MKISLNLPERFALMNSFPQKGSFIINNCLNEFSKKLIPDKKELKELDYKIINGKEAWNKEKSLKEKKFEIDEICFNVIKEELQRLDKTKQLDINEQTSLFKKFDKDFK